MGVNCRGTQHTLEGWGILYQINEILNEPKNMNSNWQEK